MTAHTEGEASYLSMQRAWYDTNAEQSAYMPGVVMRDQIVGNFAAHEEFPYESWLFRHYTPCATHLCFEYGCGPGRQIRRLIPHFRRVDGVDISQGNILNARAYLGANYDGILVENDGTNVPLQDEYDFCYSIICLQHIPVYDIRRKILTNMRDRLSPGGSICVQLAMGSSTSGTPTFAYRDNFYGATETNGKMDCRVDNEDEVREDFSDLGFVQVNTAVSETVCDHHPAWLWVYGVK